VHVCAASRASAWPLLGWCSGHADSACQPGPTCTPGVPSWLWLRCSSTSLGLHWGAGQRRAARAGSSALRHVQPPAHADAPSCSTFAEPPWTLTRPLSPGPLPR
jgi:hypothetical protein